METRLKSLHGFVRALVGISLLGFGVRYAAQARAGFEDASAPLCLCSTHVSAQEWAQVGLILAAGFWITLGIRTRVMASFMFVFFGAHAALCFSTNQTFQAQDAITFGLMANLAFLTMFGGGCCAIYQRGWSGLVN